MSGSYAGIAFWLWANTFHLGTWTLEGLEISDTRKAMPTGETRPRRVPESEVIASSTGRRPSIKDNFPARSILQGYPVPRAHDKKNSTTVQDETLNPRLLCFSSAAESPALCTQTSQILVVVE